MTLSINRKKRDILITPLATEPWVLQIWADDYTSAETLIASVDGILSVEIQNGGSGPLHAIFDLRYSVSGIIQDIRGLLDSR